MKSFLKQALSEVCFLSNLSFYKFDELNINYGFLGKNKDDSTLDPKTILRPHQIHSDILIPASDLNGTPRSIDADAIYTDTNDLIGVVTADCLPVLVVDKNKTFVLAVHAGWRGVANNIVHQSIDKVFLTNSIPSKDLLILIGPSILGGSYEVKDDVYEAIKNSGLSPDEMELCTLRYKQDSYFLDTQLSTAIKLINQGIPPSNIGLVRICTYRDPNFYSFRRDGLRCLRNFSYISKNITITQLNS